MWKVWFIIFLLFMMIEFLRHDHFFLWFAIGSLITLFTSFIITNLFVLFIIFLSTSFILSLLFSKRMPSAFRKLSTASFTTADLIGTHGKVVKTIGANTLQSGLVKLDNETWTAISAINKVIPKGSLVEVVSIEGVRLTVLPLRNHAKKEEI